MRARHSTMLKQGGPEPRDDPTAMSLIKAINFCNLPSKDDLLEIQEEMCVCRSTGSKPRVSQASFLSARLQWCLCVSLNGACARLADDFLLL